MGLVGVYLIMAVVFFALDAIALKFLMYPLFERHIGDQLRENVQVGVAAGFYAFYVAGIIYFAVQPGVAAASLGFTALNGAILGFLAYGTYEASNMATLKNWSYAMLATDIAWGTVLTATTAVAGYLAGRALL